MDLDKIGLAGTKKKMDWKRFGIIAGISNGVAFGFVGILALYLWIIGAFNALVIPLSSMAFSQEKYCIDSDSSISIVANPEDCTELNVNLKIDKGSNIISIPLLETEVPVVDEEEGAEVSTEEEIEEKTEEEKEEEIKTPIQIGTPFEIKVKQNEATLNGVAQDPINVGGEVELLAEQELIYTRCRIFVDVPVRSFSLKAVDSLGNPRELQDECYPGNVFYVEVDNLFPANSLAFSNLIPGLTDIHKIMEFKTSDNSIAQVETIISADKKTIRGKVTVLTPGDFFITATIIKSYNAILTMPDINDFSESGAAGLAEYQDALKKIQIKSEPLEMSSKDIEVGWINSTKTQINTNLFETYEFTSEQLGLIVEPKTDEFGYCPYTSADLITRISDLQVIGGYYTNDTTQYLAKDENGDTIEGKYIQLDSSYIKTEKRIIGDITKWSVQITAYKTGVEPANCLFIHLGAIETVDTLYTDIPLQITRTEVPDFYMSFKNNRIVTDGETKNGSLTLVLNEIPAEEYQPDFLNLVDKDNPTSSVELKNSTTNAVISTQTNSELNLTRGVSSYYKVLFRVVNNQSQSAQDIVCVDNNPDNLSAGTFGCLQGKGTFKGTNGSTEVGMVNNKIVPNAVGYMQIYASVVETDYYGNLIIKDNNYVELRRSANAIYVTITQPLSVYTENGVQKDAVRMSQKPSPSIQEDYLPVVESSEDFTDVQSIKDSLTGNVTAANLEAFLTTYLFIRFNSADSLAAAVYKGLTFSSNNVDVVGVESPSIGTLDNCTSCFFYCSLTPKKDGVATITCSIPDDTSFTPISVSISVYTLKLKAVELEAQNGTTITPHLAQDEKNQQYVWNWLSQATGSANASEFSFKANFNPSKMLADILVQAYRVPENFSMENYTTFNWEDYLYTANCPITIGNPAVRITEDGQVLSSNKSSLNITFNSDGELLLIASIDELYSKPLLINIVYPTIVVANKSNSYNIGGKFNYPHLTENIYTNQGLVEPLNETMSAETNGIDNFYFDFADNIDIKYMKSNTPTRFELGTLKVRLTQSSAENLSDLLGLTVEQVYGKFKADYVDDTNNFIWFRYERVNTPVTLDLEFYTDYGFVYTDEYYHLYLEPIITQELTYNGSGKQEVFAHSTLNLFMQNVISVTSTLEPDTQYSPTSSIDKFKLSVDCDAAYKSYVSIALDGTLTFKGVSVATEVIIQIISPINNYYLIEVKILIKPVVTFTPSTAVEINGQTEQLTTEVISGKSFMLLNMKTGFDEATLDLSDLLIISPTDPLITPPVGTLSFIISECYTQGCVKLETSTTQYIKDQQYNTIISIDNDTNILTFNNVYTNLSFSLTVSIPITINGILSTYSYTLNIKLVSAGA